MLPEKQSSIPFPFVLGSVLRLFSALKLHKFIYQNRFQKPTDAILVSNFFLLRIPVASHACSIYMTFCVGFLAWSLGLYVLMPFLL